MRITVKVRGMDDVLRGVNPAKYKKPINQTVEKHAMLQANDASQRAPVDSGALAASIPASISPIAGVAVGWSYGSPLIYAAVQEYTHATKKGFLRKSAFEGEPLLVKNLEGVVQKVATGDW